MRELARGCTWPRRGHLPVDGGVAPPRLPMLADDSTPRIGVTEIRTWEGRVPEVRGSRRREEEVSLIKADRIYV